MRDSQSLSHTRWDYEGCQVPPEGFLLDLISLRLWRKINSNKNERYSCPNPGVETESLVVLFSV